MSILRRESITSLTKLLEYSAAVINNNLVNEKIIMRLLKIDIQYKKHINTYHACPINSELSNIDLQIDCEGWQGRVWIFYSRAPDDFCSSYVENSLIHIGSGGGGLYNISENINKYISHPKDLPNNRYNKYNYKSLPIYPVSYGCRIFLDDLPGYRAKCLLSGNNVVQHYKGMYENPI